MGVRQGKISNTGKTTWSISNTAVKSVWVFFRKTIELLQRHPERFHPEHFPERFHPEHVLKRFFGPQHQHNEKYISDSWYTPSVRYSLNATSLSLPVPV